MGSILPVFHSEGRVPVGKDRFRVLVRLGAILWAQVFNVLAEMASAPVDLDASRFASSSAAES